MLRFATQSTSESSPKALADIARRRGLGWLSFALPPSCSSRSAPARAGFGCACSCERERRGAGFCIADESGGGDASPSTAPSFGGGDGGGGVPPVRCAPPLTLALFAELGRLRRVSPVAGLAPRDVASAPPPPSGASCDAVAEEEARRCPVALSAGEEGDPWQARYRRRRRRRRGGRLRRSPLRAAAAPSAEDCGYRWASPAVALAGSTTTTTMRRLRASRGPSRPCGWASATRMA